VEVVETVAEVEVTVGGGVVAGVGVEGAAEGGLVEREKEGAMAPEGLAKEEAEVAEAEAEVEVTAVATSVAEATVVAEMEVAGKG
jgi:hypothetical protein